MKRLLLVFTLSMAAAHAAHSKPQTVWDVLACNLDPKTGQVTDQPAQICPYRCAMHLKADGQVQEVAPEFKGTHMDGGNGFHIFNLPSDGWRNNVAGGLTFDFIPTETRARLQIITPIEQSPIVSSTEGVITSDKENALSVSVGVGTDEALTVRCWKR